MGTFSPPTSTPITSLQLLSFHRFYLPLYFLKHTTLLLSILLLFLGETHTFTYLIHLPPSDSVLQSPPPESLSCLFLPCPNPLLSKFIQLSQTLLWCPQSLLYITASYVFTNRIKHICLHVSIPNQMLKHPREDNTILIVFFSMITLGPIGRTLSQMTTHNIRQNIIGSGENNKNDEITQMVCCVIYQ